jgi:hypothetical protein
MGIKLTFSNPDNRELCLKELHEALFNSSQESFGCLPPSLGGPVKPHSIQPMSINSLSSKNELDNTAAKTNSVFISFRNFFCWLGTIIREFALWLLNYIKSCFISSVPEINKIEAIVVKEVESKLKPLPEKKQQSPLLKWNANLAKTNQNSQKKSSNSSFEEIKGFMKEVCVELLPSFPSKKPLIESAIDLMNSSKEQSLEKASPEIPSEKNENLISKIDNLYQKFSKKVQETKDNTKKACENLCTECNDMIENTKTKVKNELSSTNPSNIRKMSQPVQKIKKIEKPHINKKITIPTTNNTYQQGLFYQEALKVDKFINTCEKSLDNALNTLKTTLKSDFKDLTGTEFPHAIINKKLLETKPTRKNRKKIRNVEITDFTGPSIKHK